VGGPFVGTTKVTVPLVLVAPPEGIFGNLMGGEVESLGGGLILTVSPSSAAAFSSQDRRPPARAQRRCDSEAAAVVDFPTARSSV
jgi:hypothetical protein